MPPLKFIRIAFNRLTSTTESHTKIPADSAGKNDSSTRFSDVSLRYYCIWSESKNTYLKTNLRDFLKKIFPAKGL